MTDEIKWGRGLTGPYLKSINLPGHIHVRAGRMTLPVNFLAFLDDGPNYRLPADHFVYTVLNYNEKDGTNFHPWAGGENAPEDWDGGDVLLRYGSVLGGRNGRFFWQSIGSGSDIIGYTRKAQSQPEPAPIDWSKPIELIADGTPLVVLSGPDLQGDFRVGRGDGAPLSTPDGSDSNGYWFFTAKGEFLGANEFGPLIRNRTSKPELDDSEYVRVKRMTEKGWHLEIEQKVALERYSRAARSVVRFLSSQGLVEETPAERFKRENPGLTPDELLAKALGE